MTTLHRITLFQEEEEADEGEEGIDTQQGLWMYRGLDKEKR